METAVTEAERVLIVCTDHYAKKANSRSGGVGYEAMVITSEIAATIDSDKFVPILRADEWESASPVWLRAKIGVDLREDPFSEDQYQRLLRSLHRRTIEAPAIGPMPLFQEPDGAEAMPVISSDVDSVAAEAIVGFTEATEANAFPQSNTFHLDEETLDSGFAAVVHHGYGDFFPNPPEWDIVEANRPELRAVLMKIDLANYQPFRPTRAFAPKSKIFLRPVTLLHPVDLILYTSLVARLVSVIDDGRVPESQGRVYSFRYSGEDGELYGDDPSHTEFAEAKMSRALT